MFASDLGAWVFALIIGGLAGFLAGRRQPQDTPPGKDDHTAWLDRELGSGTLSRMLPDQTREEIRAAYGLPFAPVSPDAEGEPTAPAPEVTKGAEPEGEAPAVASPVLQAAVPRGRTAPQVVPQSRLGKVPVPTGSEPTQAVIQRPVEKASPPREPFSWDPAVLLLYLGAFLVVASGLVYASYNWADLGAWQKLGMLVTLTVAFAAGGWFLLGIERVKDAARTFVAIGALLVPANAIAAATVFDRDAASPALITLLGALATALLHGVFSVRPGGALYSYGAAIAATLAIGALVPALGPSPSWSGLAVLAAAAFLPEVVERTSDRLAHLRRPLGIVLAIATIPALALGIPGWDESRWLPAMTFTLATVAYARIALRHDHSLPAFAGGLTMALVVPASLLAIQPGSNIAWAIPIAVTAAALVAVGEFVPPWSRRDGPRLALHVESALGFVLAALFASFGPPWLASVVLAAGAIAMVVVAVLRNDRWWLLACSGFVTASWLAIPGWDRYDEWSDLTTLRYAMPVPLILAGVALGIGWWVDRNESTSRDDWRIPPWIAAGVAAAIVTLAAIGNEGTQTSDARLRWTALAAILYAGASLVGAWHQRLPPVRIAYAVWTSLAVALAASTLPMHATGQILLILVVAAAFAVASMPGMPAPLGMSRPATGNDSSLVSSPWTPSGIFGVAGGIALLGMLIHTFAYVVSRRTDETGILPSAMWPWYAYLATFLAIAAGAVWTGLRLGRDGDREGEPTGTSLAAVALGFGTVTALLVARIITTDHLAWTRAGIAVAIILAAATTLLRDRETGNAFVPVLIRGADVLAAGFGGISLAANLLLFAGDPDRVSTWSEAATFGLAGIAVLALAWWRTTPWLGAAGLGLLAIATIFAAQTGDDSDAVTVFALVALSWLALGSAIGLQRTERGARLGPSWRLASTGIGLLAIGVAVVSEPDAGPGSTGWHLVTFSLVMAAALVATEGWLRRDRRWVIGASMMALGALLLQIGAREPANIQAWTVPLALYLLGLGYVSRRSRSLRDALLAMGSIALLVPPLAEAQADGDVRQLLVAGIEALVLFVLGVFLRLRVLVAAGVATVSLIALRFLVDAAIALPGWISLLAGGLLLLVIGTALTIWKDELRERLERLQAGWHEMG